VNPAQELRLAAEALERRKRHLLEAEVPEQQRRLDAALREGAEKPSQGSPMLKGRPGWKAKQALAELNDEVEAISLQIPPMLERLAELEAGAAVDALNVAIETLAPLHAAGEAASVAFVTGLADLIRNQWPALIAAWDGLVTARSEVEAASIPAAAAQVDPTAAGRWAQSCVSPIDAPVNVGAALAMGLRVLFESDLGHGIIPGLRRLVEVVPAAPDLDVSLTVPSVFERWNDADLTWVGDHARQVAAASAARNPPPAPPISCEQAAYEAAQAAGLEDAWQRAHAGLRKPTADEVKAVRMAAARAEQQRHWAGVRKHDLPSRAMSDEEVATWTGAAVAEEAERRSAA
jgi:hypothetical protein